MADLRCIVCGGSVFASSLPGLNRCRDCSFISADLDLEPEVFQDLYGEDYFHGREYSNYVADRAIIEKNFRRRLEVLLRFVPHSQQKHLLEIGCAYGFFLHVAKQYFGSVRGIDISRPAIAHARSLGLDAVAGEFLEHEESAYYDVTCLWDTIEHLPRPDLYLAKISAQMRPGGIVAVTTGDIGSWVARMRGAKWRQIHPPTHLHYFSRATLTRLLRTHGFEVVYSGTDSVSRSLDMIAYIILVRRHGWQKAYNVLRRCGFLKGTVTVDVGDLMFFIAKKM